MTRWLVPALAATLPLHAAIITERNDVFSSFPESAIFRGTSAAPGIESQWIPYGTYTGGNGGTEYLRATSNLVGVIASVFDGYWERYNIVYNGSTNIFDYAYGELWTNDTRRILDRINDSRRLQIHGDWQGIMTNHHFLVAIEDDLCSTNGGLSFIFGSRALDSLAGFTAPPIPTSWTESIPFGASDADAWVSVFPTYDMITNDVYFLTDTTRVPNRWRYIVDWMDNGLYNAGDDFDAACEELLDEVDKRFIPVTLPEVLGHDTGLATNDFAHWRNNSTRLDWKRLGIICQLERQMETTYEISGYSDLPAVQNVCDYGNSYTGTLDVAYSFRLSDDGDGWIALGTGDLSSVSWQLASNHVSVATNQLDASFPTARAGQPYLSASTFSMPTPIQYFDLDRGDWEQFALMLFTAESTAQLDGEYIFSMWGNLGANTMSQIPHVRLTTEAGYIQDWETGEIVAGVGHSGDTASWYVDAGTARFNLRYGESKSASAVYTASDIPTVRSNLVESITPNDKYFWDNGWIASRTIWQLEMLVAATNDADVINVSDDRIYWDDLSPTSAARRAFRLNPQTARATTMRTLNDNRIDMLRSLDASVKADFATRAGQSVYSIATDKARIASGESASLRSEINAQHPECILHIDFFEDYPGIGIVFDGIIEFDNGVPTYATPYAVYGYEDNVPVVGGAFRFGQASLTLSEAKAGFSATNNPPVRVDGYPSGMLRTEWRFKNLRDPNL